MRNSKRRARSIRGEIVDFDLMEVKAQIANSPKPLEVKAREDFIDRRLRRRMKKMEDQVKQKVIEDNKDDEKEQEIIEDQIEPIKVSNEDELVEITSDVDETPIEKLTEKKRTIRKKDIKKDKI